MSRALCTHTHARARARRLSCNDVYAMLTTYGVEAARATILKEVQAVFGAYGIGVDPRHLGLIADFMTHTGGYRCAWLVCGSRAAACVGARAPACAAQRCGVLWATPRPRRAPCAESTNALAAAVGRTPAPAPLPPPRAAGPATAWASTAPPARCSR
jgi:hypothetical protein